ncbi:MAG: hypothetical protein RI947_12 [Candidatus Parcubacteria bacterium]|jgi:hypothetical protein
MTHYVHHLKKDIQRHLFDYLMLFTSGVAFLIALNVFKGEKLITFIILMAFTSVYIIWGIYHHIIDDSIRLKTVLEYILIGFTIIFLLKLLLIT